MAIDRTLRRCNLITGIMQSLTGVSKRVDLLYEEDPEPCEGYRRGLNALTQGLNITLGLCAILYKSALRGEEQAVYRKSMLELASALDGVEYPKGMVAHLPIGMQAALSRP